MHLLSALIACAGLAGALPAFGDHATVNSPRKSPPDNVNTRPLKVTPGCGKTSPKLNTFDYVNITLDDKVAPNRRYAYWLPPQYDASKPAPVIFAFHGGYQSALKQYNLDHFTWPDFNDGHHIVIYPEATTTPLFGPDGLIWQISPLIADYGVDDIKYTMAVLDRVRQDFCIDDSRVYASGMSQGGGFTNMLACDPVASIRFAAFAPVSGSYFYPPPDPEAETTCHPKFDHLTCNPGRKGIPIMATHGGNDITIPYGGGYFKKHKACIPDLDYWMRLWAERNDLDPDDVRVVPTNWDNKTVPGRKSLGADAARHVYGVYDDSRGLVSMVHAGSSVPHSWPRTFLDEEIGGAEATFNVSAMIFEFFSRFTLPSNETSQEEISGVDDGTAIEDDSPNSSNFGKPVFEEASPGQPDHVGEHHDGSGNSNSNDDNSNNEARPTPEPVHGTEPAEPQSPSGRIWPTLMRVFVEAIGSLLGLP